jgi:hypothetical protein
MRKDAQDKTEPRVIVETYAEELSTVTSNPWMVLIHKFGKRQNAYNRSVEERIQAVQAVCRRFQCEIIQLRAENDRLAAQLKTEQERTRVLFERMEHDMKVMKGEINKIRLSTKLNNTAIERHEQALAALSEHEDSLKK